MSLSDLPALQNTDEEISLLDIYDFFIENVKTIILWLLVSLFVGFGFAFGLPVKYEANAAVEPTRVATLVVDSTNNTRQFISKAVESKEVLAEKLKSPTYFPEKTIQICGLSDKPNPQLSLTQSLVTSIPRNSNFVSLSFKASSPELAKSCIMAVLDHIVMQQAIIAAPMIDNIKVAASTLNEQLQAAKLEQQQLQTQNQEKLNIAKAKLAADVIFVDQFSKDALNFNFNDPQFSASALLLSTIINKQKDMKELEVEINRLQMQVDAKITSKDNEVLEISKQLNDIRNALTPPETQVASFATPIYAPNEKVEPKRSIIMLLSLVAGFALSILFLVGRNALHHVEVQRKAMLKKIA